MNELNRIRRLKSGKYSGYNISAVPMDYVLWASEKHPYKLLRDRFSFEIEKREYKKKFDERVEKNRPARYKKEIKRAKNQDFVNKDSYIRIRELYLSGQFNINGKAVFKRGVLQPNVEIKTLF